MKAVCLTCQHSFLERSTSEVTHLQTQHLKPRGMMDYSLVLFWNFPSEKWHWNWDTGGLFHWFTTTTTCSTVSSTFRKCVVLSFILGSKFLFWRFFTNNLSKDYLEGIKRIFKATPNLKHIGFINNLSVLWIRQTDSLKRSKVQSHMGNFYHF